MARRSTRSSGRGLPRARRLCRAGASDILALGADPASLPFLLPKLGHVNVLVEGVKLYAANILKQSMLSIGGDVAVHRDVISGKAESSTCLVMGDLRHYRLLIDKLGLQKGLEPLAEAIRRQVFPDEGPLEMSLCGRRVVFTELPVIMGILNVTPDSFSDGGAFLGTEAAVRHALEMVEHGAEMIDVGGESTRPGAVPVDGEEEIRRVVPVIERIVKEVDVPVSVDTSKHRVARAALEAGAVMVNDVTALRNDPAMMGLVRSTGCGVVLMHMRGTPSTMQSDTSYGDVVAEVYAFLDERIEACLEAGIDPACIAADPGIGFGKDLAGNLALVRHISEFSSLGVPVLLGHSRKSFIGAVLDSAVDNRQDGTDAVTAWAAANGVDIVRVHDCRRAKRTRAMIRAIAGA
ncbi:MAG TPA: dihydropteroate synthase [Deltaproteobacteria bacterium]|nr:dihydropteroate synthase [Deltaproteobacteria bacterium]HPP80658.1 dihydropteroate synthase [Deltaproteobacteria bacterium]